MLDRVVNQGLNQPQESFYFQLIPISLTLVDSNCELPAKGTTYRFSVFKGTYALIQVPRNSTKTGSQSQPNSQSLMASMCCPSTPAVSISTYPPFQKAGKYSSPSEWSSAKTVLTTPLETMESMPMPSSPLLRRKVLVDMNWNRTFRKTMNSNLKSMLTTTGLLWRRTSGIIDKIEPSSHLSEPEKKTAHSQAGRTLLRRRKLMSHRGTTNPRRKLVLSLQLQNLS